MPEINLPEVVSEVWAVFDRYERALLANNVPILEELFWRASLTVRYGVGESLHGWDAISAFRRARQTGPFRRTLVRTVITTFDRDFATADTEYLRDDHDHMGRESKTLVRMGDDWRIVSAHVSLIGETV